MAVPGNYADQFARCPSPAIGVYYDTDATFTPQNLRRNAALSRMIEHAAWFVGRHDSPTFISLSKKVGLISMKGKDNVCETDLDRRLAFLSLGWLQRPEAAGTRTRHLFCALQRTAGTAIPGRLADP